MFAAVLALLVLCDGSPTLSTISPHVRTPSGVLRSLLDEAGTLPTTARLLQRLELSDEVVYVVFTVSPEIPTARTKLVTATSAARFLRIDINARIPPGDRLPLLAHELQHAVELADASDVRDDEGVRRLYARIGTTRDRDHFETPSAHTVERMARREMASALVRLAPRGR
ncbi:MAG TPA: hypothetical protein VNR64_00300 [Vicinamibacterales bacterium]|nr:hypothetical protein [Vicinamibacterales bacterium]